MFFQKKTGNKGFTLIELLVVIAIIGILASVVLASSNSARMKSRDARRLADVKQLQVALEMYFDDNANNYPAVITDLSGATACGAKACISTIPIDPISPTTDYVYTQVSGTDYTLEATLEDTANPALVGVPCGAGPPVYCVMP